MKVLVIGSGGREHALAWKLLQSRNVDEVVCAPGNAGTAAIARNVPLAVEDQDLICALARDERVGLVVVGPEAPLCRGLADRLRAAGTPVFGPDRAAAELEGSKAFAKDLMSRNGIPTAGWRVFKDRTAAREYLAGAVAWPVVVKASGLAAGKGVVICADRAEAEAALDRMMVDRVFGTSGETVVIEDWLAGEEVSIHCVTDGATLFMLPTSQDHKRVFDGDQGPNTGGMGAVSPAAVLEGPALERVEREVLFPTLHALSRARRPYRGVLYAGLMATRTGTKVLEYNVRFGDPETQVLLPRLRGDLLDLLLRCAEGGLDTLDEASFSWDPRVAVGVVIAAGGYPGNFRRGDVIEGLEDAAALPGISVFHAGTTLADGRAVTDGGRVLCVTALGEGFGDARRRAYEAVGLIRFPGMHFRRDIGSRAMAKES